MPHRPPRQPAAHRPPPRPRAASLTWARWARTLLAACAVAPVAAQEATLHPALNSYAQPPFSAAGADRSGGLAAVLVEQLNAAPQVPVKLHLEPLPRRRLELTLESPSFAGAALFLAPEFLPQGLVKAGVWSAPVMVDENLLVSVRPLPLTSLDGLAGLRFGAIAGHVYPALGILLDGARIERADAPDHVANLKKLCLGRVDFVVISKSEFAGTAPLAPCAQPLRPLPFPEPQIIVRRVLVRLPAEADADRLLAAIAHVACGERWHAALAGYGLSTVGCGTRSAARLP